MNPDTSKTLHAWAAGTPSAETWRLICQTLAALPDDEVDPVALEGIEAALEHWPVELRATMCGMKWDEMLIDGTADPRLRLVRVLRYDRIFSGRYTGIMIRKPDVHPGRIARGRAPATWNHLVNVNLRGQKLGVEDMDAIASAELPRLRSLCFSCDGIAFATLCRSRVASRLTSLSIDLGEPFDQAFDALGEAHLDHLRDLSLSHTSPTADAVARFARTAHLPALEQLSFYGAKWTPEAAEGLAQLPRRLASLSFHDAGFGAEHVARLLSGKLATKYLGLGDNPLGAEGVRALAEHGVLTEEVGLTGCGLDDEALRVLASAELPALRKLDVAEGWGNHKNRFGTEGLDALLGAALPLSSLSIDGAFQRVAGPALRRLQSLRMKGLAVGCDLGAVTTDMAALEHLRLDGTGATALFEAIAGGPVWQKQIRSLSLTGLGRMTRGFFYAVSRMEALESVTFEKGKASLRDLLPLLESGLPLKTLSLANNPIGDEGAAALAQSPLLAGLTTLDLSGCRIGDAGAAALASSPHLAHVERVILDENDIHDEGAVPLIQRTRVGAGWMNVSLYKNPTGPGAKDALKDVPPRCCP